MKSFDWKKALDAASKIADVLSAGSLVRADVELLKRAGGNLLFAAKFPMAEGFRAWRGSSGTMLERASRVLAEPQVRNWLEAWAEAPRAMRSMPRNLQ